MLCAAALSTAFCAGISSSCQAESRRNTNSIAPADQRIQELLDQKPKADPSLYEQLFSPSDNDIRNRFGAPAGAPTAAFPFHSHPALADAQTREDMALYVVRLRLNSGFSNSMRMLNADKKLPALQNIQKAQRAIDQIRQQSVVMGSGPEPIVFKFGYDLVTDVTQLGWQKGAMQAGIVHAGLFNCMRGRGASLADALLHFSTSLRKTAPRAFVGMPLRANAVDFGLAQTLAPGTEAQVRFGSLPASGSIPQHERVQATLALPF